MIGAAPLFVLLATLAAASAADARRAAASPPPERLVISLIVYGNDSCPKSEGDEIVVCARKPESERYRIPKDLRRQEVVAGPQSWSSRVATMDAEARKNIPGSCSPIGTNGYSGCTRAALDRWFQERRLDARP